MKKKLTKEDIQAPASFRHVSHVGWEPEAAVRVHFCSVYCFYVKGTSSRAPGCVKGTKSH